MSWLTGRPPLAPFFFRLVWAMVQPRRSRLEVRPRARYRPRITLYGRLIFGDLSRNGTA
ncbi:hypothetical protein [Streptomyces sp. NPDC048489]|uniref:hypothetical protein n=1 Tax=Streptomyces sp. NPDC048489 TaxID=3154504 RepID=UPI0034191A8A